MDVKPIDKQHRITSSSPSIDKIHEINDNDEDEKLNAALREGAKKLRKQEEERQKLDKEIMQYNQ